MNLVRRDAGDIRVFGLDNRQDEVAGEVPYRVRVRLAGLLGRPDAPGPAGGAGPFYPSWNDATFDRLAARFELADAPAVRQLSARTKMKFAAGDGAVARRGSPDPRRTDGGPRSGLPPGVPAVARGLLQDEGKSVLFSTHITSDLDRVADYVTFVRRGRSRSRCPGRTCSTPGAFFGATPPRCEASIRPLSEAGGRAASASRCSCRRRRPPAPPGRRPSSTGRHWRTSWCSWPGEGSHAA